MSCVIGEARVGVLDRSFIGERPLDCAIWREIERCGAGLVEGDTADGATSLLNRWMNLSDSDRAEMRRHAHACFLENFEARGAALGFVESIAGAIGKAGAA